MSNTLKFEIDVGFSKELSPTLKGVLVKEIIGKVLEAQLAEELVYLSVHVGGREVLIKTLDKEKIE